MTATKAQITALLPWLQRAVQAQIDRWDAEREIEHLLDVELDEMAPGIEDLAVSVDCGADVTRAQVEDYLSEF